MKPPMMVRPDKRYSINEPSNGKRNAFRGDKDTGERTFDARFDDFRAYAKGFEINAVQTAPCKNETTGGAGACAKNDTHEKRDLLLIVRRSRVSHGASL